MFTRSTPPPSPFVSSSGNFSTVHKVVCEPLNLSYAEKKVQVCANAQLGVVDVLVACVTSLMYLHHDGSYFTSTTIRCIRNWLVDVPCLIAHLV